MEGDYLWHGKPPNAQQADEALRELAAAARRHPRRCIAERKFSTRPHSACTSPTIARRDLKLVPTRNGFGEGLIEAGSRNRDVLGICADLVGVDAL